MRNLLWRRRSHAVPPALAAIALVLGAAPARADDPGTYLLGDWGGTRTRLANEGITFNLGYGSEIAHNFSGGTDHLTRYADQWAFGARLDLDKLWNWKGGTFQVTFTERNGRDLGADAHIGNNMLIQEIFGRGQTWHLTQFWLDQKLLGDRLQIKLGRLTVGEDFASFSCDFQNLTFCGSQPGNLVGNYWVNWPTSQWATRLKYLFSPEIYAQIGVYQVNPHYVDDAYARRNGWKLDNPSGTTGALVPIEAGWLRSMGGLPGSYKVGAWYNTSNADDLELDVNRDQRGVTGLGALRRSGQYGGYLNFQQQVSGTPKGRGATVFLNISQADRNTARVDRQIALGVQYQGPFARARDVIGLAVGATHNNGRNANFVRQNNQRTGQNVLAGDGNEYVTELYYSWSPLPSVYFRPNAQYIRHPGGTRANKDAFVIGMKTGVTF